MNPKLSSHPVIKDFLHLTKFTTPYGSEHSRFKKLLLTLGCVIDPSGNFALSIGESRTMFAAHLDTADRTSSRVRRKIKGDTVSTDGTTILGADNRAGVAVMLHLIRNQVPGHYMFFVGEEHGRVGSRAAAATGNHDGLIDRVICWDRMGTNSIITHQMGERSCSNEFADALADAYYTLNPALKLSRDDGGTYTDSYSYLDSVPECTNISVGYFNQHSTSEVQDARFLVYIAEASVHVDWERLPVMRDPNVIVYDTPKYHYQWHEWDMQDYEPTQVYNLTSAAYDLIEYSERGLLRLQDVEEFVFAEPETAAKMLFDKLKRGW